MAVRANDNAFNAWCYTVFKDGDGAWMKSPKFKKKKILYLIRGTEVCPDTAKEHLQCYVYYRNAIRFTTLKKKYPALHWEKARGSPKQNRKYCSKDDKFREYGVLPKQGKRNDFAKLLEMTSDGGNQRKIYTEMPGMFRYVRAVDKCQERFGAKRKWKMDVDIYWGPPEAGKSRVAWDAHPDLYEKSKNKWWDGYDGEEAVLIDDFDPATQDWRFDYMLTLLDRYPMKVEVKGGMVQFRSKKVYITSNFNPFHWFPGRKNRAAFFRRVSRIYVCEAGAEPKLQFENGEWIMGTFEMFNMYQGVGRFKRLA